MTTANDDYVLGTDEAEVHRLGLQHRVWREAMLAGWRRGGLTRGDRAVDLGAGPGYATLDLAEIVGPSGRVLAVERSARFVGALRAEVARRDIRHVDILEGDLMDLVVPPGFDFVWCRWVASFVESVPDLVRRVGEALRPGGTAVFHEYIDYASWRWAPARPRLEEFVAEVMASWRASGGEPDVAPALVGSLRANGFELREARPLGFATTPRELTWHWPAAFIATNTRRLSAQGRVSSQWADAVLTELDAAERDPASIMVTPLVLEVVAQRSEPAGTKAGTAAPSLR